VEHTVLGSLVECAKQEGATGERAFVQIYDYFFRPAYNTALRITKNEQDAADITQEVMTSLYKNLHAIKDPKALVAYVNRIVKSKCVDFVRKQQNQPFYENYENDEVKEAVMSSVADTDIDFIPQDFLLKKEDRGQVTKALDALAPNQRIAIISYYYNQMPIKAIAEDEGVSEDVIKKRLSRGRQALKEMLETSMKGMVVGVVYEKSILTQILEAEAAEAATVEICTAVWQHVATQIGFSAEIIAATIPIATSTASAYAVSTAVAATAATSAAGAGVVATSVSTAAKAATVAGTTGISTAATIASSGGIFAAIGALSVSAKVTIVTLCAATAVSGSVLYQNHIAPAIEARNEARQQARVVVSPAQYSGVDMYRLADFPRQQSANVDNSRAESDTSTPVIEANVSTLSPLPESFAVEYGNPEADRLEEAPLETSAPLTQAKTTEYVQHNADDTYYVQDNAAFELFESHLFELQIPQDPTDAYPLELEEPISLALPPIQYPSTPIPQIPLPRNPYIGIESDPSTETDGGIPPTNHPPQIPSPPQTPPANINLPLGVPSIEIGGAQLVRVPAGTVMTEQQILDLLMIEALNTDGTHAIVRLDLLDQVDWGIPGNYPVFINASGNQGIWSRRPVVIRVY